MSDISALATATGAATSTPIYYSPLDTNEDGKVTSLELAAAMESSFDDELSETDTTLFTAEQTLPVEVANALFDVRVENADETQLSFQVALEAYVTPAAQS